MSLNKQVGFTLIEVLVTMSIIAILLALVSSGMSYVMSKQRVNVYAEQVARYLNMARSTALEKHKRVVVCPVDIQNQCQKVQFWQTGWIIFIDNNQNITYDAGDDLLHHIKPKDSGIVMKTSINRSALVYQPDGTSPGTNLSFSICIQNQANKSLAVIVSNAGRIRIAKTLPNRKKIVC